MHRFIVLAGIVTLANPATGALINEYHGAGFAIPDGSPAGPGVASGSILISESFLTFDIWVTVEGLHHGWAGDLTMTLTSSSGTQVSLVDHVGRTVPGGQGDSSNFGGDYTFRDGQADLWAAAAAALGTETIAPGGYAASGAFGAPVSLQSALAGENSLGVWTLTISDSFALDQGSITGWTLTFYNMPSPWTAALGLGLLGMRLRRR